MITSTEPETWPRHPLILRFLLTVYPLPDDKILALSKLKASADDIPNVTQNIKFDCHRVESIVRKGENAGYQHFLLFPQCFERGFSSGASRVVQS